MSNRAEVHVKLYYVEEPENRDKFNELSDETKKSWRNALLGTDQIDEPGEQGNFVLTPTEDEIEAIKSAKNVAYVEKAIEATTQDHDVVMAEDVSPDQVYPDPEMMKYHNAEGTESDPNTGQGYGLWHCDTGASRDAESKTTGGIKGRSNYTGGSATDTTDRQGHGSETLNLGAVGKVWAWVNKVLGDNGSGSSTGIIAAIRGAAKFVRENPEFKGKIILSGSLGGPPGQKLQAYTDACADAEDAGVLCLWSAGNDGQNAIGAPGNWKPKRASIAFTLSNLRASFSNYASWAGCASQGERVLMINKDGQFVYGNGTSFSLPDLVRHIFVVAWQTGSDVFTAYQAILDTCRDTPEPFEEESSGAINVKAAIAKLSKKPGEQPKQPSSGYYPNLPRLTKTQINAMQLSKLDDCVGTSYGVERGVWFKKGA